MGLLTIRAFAQAARLTPKALRLCDEPGLLRPAPVDPESGYRFYDPAQLAQGRLIARLRRIGMPLAEIRTVCGLDPADAADAIAAYWHRVTAETAARGRLATLLGRSRGTARGDRRASAGQHPDRDPALRLPQDHTYVQSLVDQGKLGPGEAAVHPQRSLLVRALGAGGQPVVDRAALHCAMDAAADPEQAVQRLVELAHANGAPDNVACVVADVTEAD